MIKFHCPSCQIPIEAPDEILGEQATCPACLDKFWPVNFVSVKAPAPAKPENKISPPSSLENSLHITAWRFNFGAAIFAAIATLFLIAIIVAIFSSEVSWPGWYGFVGAATIAIWLFLVAQIIHIRILLLTRK